MKESKARVIEWLLEHLPGGAEAQLDHLPRIVMSLEAKPLKFLHALKQARMKVEASRRVATDTAKDEVRAPTE